MEYQQRFIKKRWSFKHKKRGKKPVSAVNRALILEMKTDNPLWALVAIFQFAARASIPDVEESQMN